MVTHEQKYTMNPVNLQPATPVTHLPANAEAVTKGYPQKEMARSLKAMFTNKMFTARF